MRRRQTNRRGATVLELSLILAMFLIMTIGTIDLSISVFRSHILAQAAREGARRAIVHGSRANVLGSWGPATINAHGSDTGEPIVDGEHNGSRYDGIKGMLIGCDLSQTTIKVEWPDGSNEPGDPVKVTLTSPYNPAFLWFISSGTKTATSTMLIAH